MAKPKKYDDFWLARDRGTNSGYELYHRKPTKLKPLFYLLGKADDAERLDSFCADLFEKYFPNCKMKPGECRQISTLKMMLRRKKNSG